MKDEVIITETKKASARMFYEFNDISLAAVAERFELPARTLQNWAQKEGWVRNGQAAALREAALKAPAFSAASQAKAQVAALVEAVPNSNLIPANVKDDLVTTKFAAVMGGAQVKSEMTMALLTLRAAMHAADARGDEKATVSAARDYFECLNKFNAALFGTTANININANIGSKIESMSEEELEALILDGSENGG